MLQLRALWPLVVQDLRTHHEHVCELSPFDTTRGRGALLRGSPRRARGSGRSAAVYTLSQLCIELQDLWTYYATGKPPRVAIEQLGGSLPVRRLHVPARFPQ